MSCKCQGCGSRYKVDLNIPNEVWRKIRPEGKPPEGGLLCGSCIMGRIEAIGEYGVLHVAATPQDSQPADARKGLGELRGWLVQRIDSELPESLSNRVYADGMKQGLVAALAKLDALTDTPDAQEGCMGCAHGRDSTFCSKCRRSRPSPYGDYYAPATTPKCEGVMGSMCTVLRPLGGGTPRDCDGLDIQCDHHTGRKPNTAAKGQEAEPK
jgi:hypothetical protein